MSESFADLFEESLKTIDMQSGSIITGVVVDIDNEWVTVHAGLKSEGIIPRSQFLNESGEVEVHIGDKIRSDSCIWSCMIEYAAQLINTYQGGHEDGKAPRDRLRGSPSKPDINTFAEPIYFKQAS